MARTSCEESNTSMRWQTLGLDSCPACSGLWKGEEHFQACGSRRSPCVPIQRGQAQLTCVLEDFDTVITRAFRDLPGIHIHILRRSSDEQNASRNDRTILKMDFDQLHYQFRVSHRTLTALKSNDTSDQTFPPAPFSHQGVSISKLALREPLGHIVEQILPASLDHIPVAGDNPVKIPLLDHIN